MEINNAEGIEETQGPVEEEKSPEVLQMEGILDALEGIEGAPNMVDLETWKANWGQYFASSILADENIYIWRTLKRADQKKIAASGAMNQEDLYQDSVVRTCLLWPQPSSEWFFQQDAGTLPSLFKQIMYKSGFVSEEMALRLINPI